jgi:Skp family chaperone for outer membrane proteins
MTNLSRTARALVAASVLTLVAPAYAAGPPPPAAGTPNPKILVIDRAAILRGSVVGQNIMKQVQALTIAAEQGLKARDVALRAEGQQLQQQLAILAPAVKAAKIKAFEAKQAALQADVQKQQGLIQGGVLKARQQVEQALGPILQGLMQERGANLLLDRNAVVLGTVNVDITKDAIGRLNQKLPNVKVALTALPPGVAPQQ